MKDVQRVWVVTAKGQPTILVHEAVRDVFIDELIRERYGWQKDGTGHLWEAYDVEEELVRAAAN